MGPPPPRPMPRASPSHRLAAWRVLLHLRRSPPPHTVPNLRVSRSLPRTAPTIFAPTPPSRTAGFPQAPFLGPHHLPPRHFARTYPSTGVLPCPANFLDVNRSKEGTTKKTQNHHKTLFFVVHCCCSCGVRQCWHIPGPVREACGLRPRPH